MAQTGSEQSVRRPRPSTDVACPRCGAEVGEPCRKIIGGVGHRATHIMNPHHDRILVAKGYRS